MANEKVPILLNENWLRVNLHIIGGVVQAIGILKFLSDREFTGHKTNLMISSNNHSSNSVIIAKSAITYLPYLLMLIIGSAVPDYQNHEISVIVASRIIIE
jgi:hypothetical protein